MGEGGGLFKNFLSLHLFLFLLSLFSFLDDLAADYSQHSDAAHLPSVLHGPSPSNDQHHLFTL